MLTAKVDDKKINSSDPVQERKTVIFTAQPNSGFMVDTWTVSGSTFEDGSTTQQGGDTATVSVKNNDITVMVSFKVEYKKVPYDDLETYLKQTASETAINYIELTGTIPTKDFKGDDRGGNTSPGALGQKIKKYIKKKVALKLPETIPNLTDMTNCFYKCENLVSLVNVPTGVTNIERCFCDCTSLETAPILPESITNMTLCFENCTNLKEAPAIPSKVTQLDSCFQDCTNLIKAPSTLPINVTNLHGCFASCSNLTEAPVIPSSVTDLSSCFIDCSKLKSVTLKCSYHAQDFGHAFSGCTTLSANSIKVPANLLKNYQDGASDMGVDKDRFVADTK